MDSAWPGTPSEWALFAILAGGLFGLFHGTALALGSDRGQHGVPVALVVVAALVAVERRLSGKPLPLCLGDLGLGVPSARGLILATVLALGLVVVAGLFLRESGVRVAFIAGWSSTLPGLFAQAGIAEETLFRGFLFRRLRAGRSFGRAVALSSAPFVLAHLPLFWTLPWPLAAASLGLSVATSFSFARLFELGGATVWPPAIVHFVVQGAVKVLALEQLPAEFPLLWMFASALVTQVVFLEGRRRQRMVPELDTDPHSG